MEKRGECAPDSVRYKKKVENERVFEFLARLNHKLDDVRGRILERRPLPMLREVFSEVRREGSGRQVMLTEGIRVEPEENLHLYLADHTQGVDWL